MNVKTTLLSSGIVVLVMSSASSGLQADVYQGEGHLLGTSEDLVWGPVASMGEGAQMASIEGTLSEADPFTLRLKLEDGYEIKPHTHPAYERVTVLEGTLHFAHGEEFNRDETQQLPVGGYAIMPPGAPMFGYAEGETTIQLHGEGPWGIEYINDEDDPRN